MLVIGICGASGSGKSTLAQELCSAIGPCATVINHDCYYRDHPSLTLEERQQLNYDEPEIFDHDLFLEDMKTLMAGKPITRKRYDYTNHRRTIENISVQYLTTVKPMYDKHIRNYIDLADVIVAHGGKNARIVSILAGYVRDVLNGEKPKYDGQREE